MNRIDRIISESIDKFILREISMSDFERKIAPRKAKVKNKKTGEMVDVTAKTDAELRRGAGRVNGVTVPLRQYNRKPKPKDLYDACVKFPDDGPDKAKAIAKVIKNEWYSRDLEGIYTFNKNGYFLGAKDSQNLHKRLSTNNNEKDPFFPIASNYRQLMKFTNDIQEWGKAGEYKTVESRLCDMPIYLDNLADAIVNWLSVTKNEVSTKGQMINTTIGVGQTKTGRKRKGNIINGYDKKGGGKAIKGLKQVRGSTGSSSAIVNKLRECASTIRSLFGDNNKKK